MKRVSVIIPTVDGREDHYARCKAAYKQNTAGCDLEVVTERNHATCGLGWQAGAERATGDYLHFTCDDIEAAPGWAQPAVDALEKGFQPAPRVTDPSGTPQYRPAWGTEWPDWTPAEISILPFITRDLWENAVRPLFTGHYYTDDFISWRAREAGYEVRVRTGYSFTHHWAQHRRGAGVTEPQRMEHDARLFSQAQMMVRRGEWTRPWPLEVP